MNTQEQIEALMKLDGWTLARDYHNEASMFYLNAFKNRMGDGRPDWKSLPFPDYLHSRDVIIELISKQPKEAQWAVHYNLCEYFVLKDTTGRLQFPIWIQATAKELVEALLRALNLWKD